MSQKNNNQNESIYDQIRRVAREEEEAKQKQKAYADERLNSLSKSGASPSKDGSPSLEERLRMGY